MKTLKRVPCTLEIVEEYIPAKEDMVQGVIYLSEKYHCAVHLCLCGECGIQTVMPLNTETRHSGWDYSIKNNKVSFLQSVGNYQFPCKSHYIIIDNVANFV